MTIDGSLLDVYIDDRDPADPLCINDPLNWRQQVLKLALDLSSATLSLIRKSR